MEAELRRQVVQGLAVKIAFSSRYLDWADTRLCASIAPTSRLTKRLAVRAIEAELRRDHPVLWLQHRHQERR